MRNKLSFAIFLLILLIPFTFADIDLKMALKEKYNLGDPIKSSFNVNIDTDFSGLFRLTLFCDSFGIDYFVTLIDIKQNERVTVIAPEIKPKARMKGNCRLIASLESLNKEIFEKFDSPKFRITDELTIYLDLSKDSILPGETININGRIDASLDNSDELSVIVSFDGKQEELVLEGKEFNKELNVGDTTLSGKHILFLEAKDSFGNNGDKVFNVIVKPKVSKIDLELNKKTFKPKEIIEIKPVIYDQAGEVVLDEDLLVVVAKEEDELFSKNIKSYEKATYTFLQYAEPGEYSAKAHYDNLITEKTFKIEELKKLDIKLVGETVHIKNIGNVKYKEVLSINLFGGEKNYVLNKRVKLNPDEEITIDLSKEVPTDNYAVEVIADDRNMSLTDGVTIEDRRTLFDKITGAAVGRGLLINRPVLAGFIMFLIISLITFFFVRRRRKQI